VARSAEKRRDRRSAVAAGARRKPPETFQPSERAAEVRACMHETVIEQLRTIREAASRVRSVPIAEPISEKDGFPNA
jgi:hypothetical protein